MKLPLPVCTLLFCLFLTKATAQENPDLVDKITSFPSKFLDKLNKKANELEEKLIAKTEKALSRLEKQERKLQKKLAKKDSLLAAQTFGDIEGKYAALRAKLDQGANLTSKANLNHYIPYLDTLKTSLQFLGDKGDQFFKQGLLQKDKLDGALASVKGFDDKLSQANAIRDYLKQRRQELREKLGSLGFMKELKKINKEVYYYSQQIQEYKDIFKDPQKLEQKAIGIVTRLPFFKEFLAKHSELAALFPNNANYGTPAGLIGLQARVDVQALLQRQLQAGGPGAQQYVQQNIQQAQAQLNTLKNKINSLGGGGSDREIPDFKPNNQKTKSFWKRVELGTDLQNTRGTSFLPITSDLGLSVGFRIDDRNVFGFGASYKMGWGKDIRRISITHEGIGLRSYLDIKLKGSFFISGGYEQNYRTRFDNIQQLRVTPSNWMQSGLVGVKKKYSIGKKYKGNMQLLFDFLYKTHVPETQMILFRLGYGL